MSATMPTMKFKSLLSWFKRERYTESGIVWGPIRNTASGRHVSDEGALKVSAVYSCVRVLTESIASLPLILYQRGEDGSKERAVDHPLYALFHDRPNELQSSFDFFEQVVVSLCLRGNAYAQKILNGAGRVIELWPLPPDKVQIEVTSGGEKKFFYHKNGVRLALDSDEIVHFKGLSTDGIRGLSPIDCARESIGVALATEEHGARFFSNGASPTGVLEHPASLSDEAANRIRQSWEERYAGSSNAHRVVVLEENMKWHQLSLTNEQSQFLETRKFQISEIARWFRVPPHMVGDLERATFSNIEHQALEFVTHTLRPWLVRIERTLLNSVFSADEAREYVLEFLADALLRGDIKTRYEAYALGRTNGWLNVDEIRAKENMNPLPDGQGQKYLQPLNMTEVGKEDEAPGADEDETSDTEEELDRAFREVLKETLHKYVRRARKSPGESIFEHVHQALAPLVRMAFVRRGKAHLHNDAVRDVIMKFCSSWQEEGTTKVSEETEDQETLRRVDLLLELCS